VSLKSLPRQRKPVAYWDQSWTPIGVNIGSRNTFGRDPALVEKIGPLTSNGILNHKRELSRPAAALALGPSHAALALRSRHPRDQGASPHASLPPSGINDAEKKHTLEVFWSRDVVDHHRRGVAIFAALEKQSHYTDGALSMLRAIQQAFGSKSFLS